MEARAAGGSGVFYYVLVVKILFIGDIYRLFENVQGEKVRE